jgi:hypothetical protein
VGSEPATRLKASTWLNSENSMSSGSGRSAVGGRRSFHHPVPVVLGPYEGGGGGGGALQLQGVDLEFVDVRGDGGADGVGADADGELEAVAVAQLCERYRVVDDALDDGVDDVAAAGLGFVQGNEDLVPGDDVGRQRYQAFEGGQHSLEGLAGQVVVDFGVNVAVVENPPPAAEDTTT